MAQMFDRRMLIIAGATAPLLALPGCATTGGFSMVDAIRRLLSLSSQRAFAALLQPGGFYDSAVARVALPEQFAANTNLLSRILTTSAVRERLSRTLNGFAERGAERAAPIIADAITSISVADAMAIVRGGPSAATALLEQQLAGGLINAMFPTIGDAMRVANDPTISRALSALTGYDVAGLARDVTSGADRGIWRAIGAEEAAIRADPQSSGDPVLTAVFGLARAGG
jgi:hypothetical protein